MRTRRKSVKLHDIAVRAGVSVNTVSRALRNKPDVGEKTRETILRLAKELGYVIPSQASSRSKNPVIGVLVQDILNPFYAKVVQGIEGVLWQERANFLFGCSYRQESKEKDVLSFFSQQQVDGLLITSVVNPEYVISYLEHSNIPTIFLSQRFEQYEVDYVINDNSEGAFIATDHLIKLGHTRIAHVMALDTQLSARERLRGYQKALENAGIPGDSRLLRSGDSTIESGYYLTKDLLLSGEKMTALFAYNDIVALGAFRAIREANLQVPADISLVGYDDIMFAEFFEIPLTTVHQPTIEISRKAAELLFEKIKARPNYKTQQVVLKPRLVVRSSTSICPE
jgi:LacI family transcriptional regulator